MLPSFCSKTVTTWAGENRDRIDLSSHNARFNDMLIVGFLCIRGRCKGDKSGRNMGQRRSGL